jgi:phosphoglycolate phosphatase
MTAWSVSIRAASRPRGPGIKGHYPARVPDRDTAVVLFDLDGVLADSRAAITGCMNAALAATGLPERPPAELYRYIGPPLPFAFAALTGEDAASETVTALVAEYRARYAGASLTDTVVTPGIAAPLEQLRRAGRRLGVATSKPQPFAEPLLEALGLRRFFAVVAGPALDVPPEDKTTTVGAALRALGARSGVMVGDTSFDMIAARAHGLFAVGVGWGIGSRAELLAAGAERIVATPAELPDAVAA